MLDIIEFCFVFKIRPLQRVSFLRKWERGYREGQFSDKCLLVDFIVFQNENTEKGGKLTEFYCHLWICGMLEEKECRG